MWKIFVGNLDSRIREIELADEFNVYGVVKSVWIARNPPGYAFVEFNTRREADDAISALDGKHGWRVEMSRRSSSGRSNRSHSSEIRCHERGSSVHRSRDCRSGPSKQSYRRSLSPRPRGSINRHSPPRRHSRSRSPRKGHPYEDSFIINRDDSTRRRERSRSPMNDRDISPPIDRNISPPVDEDSSHADEISPARNEQPSSRSPQQESSPEN